LAKRDGLMYINVCAATASSIVTCSQPAGHQLETAVPTKSMLSRELKALQEEIAASQRERSTPGSAPQQTSAAAPVAQPEHTEDEKKLREEIREFIDEATHYFDEAEKNISAHPTASVIGALVVGILIGRLIGRR
jgi:ElaB/YqjD/DUF883 family membrane-anchored ribosome-binding protein